MGYLVSREPLFKASVECKDQLAIYGGDRMSLPPPPHLLFGEGVIDVHFSLKGSSFPLMLGKQEKGTFVNKDHSRYEKHVFPTFTTGKLKPRAKKGARSGKVP